MHAVPTAGFAWAKPQETFNLEKGGSESRKQGERRRQGNPSSGHVSLFLYPDCPFGDRVFYTDSQRPGGRRPGLRTTDTDTNTTGTANRSK